MVPAAAAVVLAIYVALSLFNPSVAGYLSTDTGGKTATLEYMSREGTLTPSVGYWAEEFDPEGQVHPFWFTDRVGDAWVNVTTLPVLYAALPLYELGGYHLALLLPMLGGVASAFAARSIARRLAGGDQWSVFWLAALASPLAIYSLDFWEHTIGAAFTLWGFRALLEVWKRPTTWSMAALAGAAFGAGASMRTEVVVFGFAAVAVVCLDLLRRRLLLSAVVQGTLAAVGFGALATANSLLEKAALDEVRRAGRAATTASVGGGKLGLRIEEAFITGFGLFPTDDITFVAMGVVFFALLAGVVAMGRSQPESVPLVFIVIAGLLFLRALSGLGFVPGATATVPLIAAAAVAGWRHASLRIPLLIAAVAVPLVWAFQFTGGAVPQWGGRYLLPGSILLLSVGAVALQKLGNDVLLKGFAVLSVLITLFGLGWTHQRTNDFSDALHGLADRPEPALVFEPAFMAREAGPLMLDEQWLTAATDESIPVATNVLRQAGIDEFGYIDLVGEAEVADATADQADAISDAKPIDGYNAIDVGFIEVTSGAHFRITTYVTQP